MASTILYYTIRTMVQYVDDIDTVNLSVLFEKFHQPNSESIPVQVQYKYSFIRLYTPFYRLFR
jgi:hypothetical protein